MEIDVLMVTYNRPEYTRVSLKHLLESAEDSTRIWVWRNGEDEETLRAVQEHSASIHRLHHSKENVGLTAPTNWLFKEATGDLLGKVDHDCVVDPGWISRIMEAHLGAPELGVVACWHFQPEDFVPEVANRKIRSFLGGHRLLVSMWVVGSGYVVKRACVERLGLLGLRDTFSSYCIELARAGWTNGWLSPFVYQDHIDDPRSVQSGIRFDSGLAKCLPLSARKNGMKTVDKWTAQPRRSALLVQDTSMDRDPWSRPRQMLRRIGAKLKRIATGSHRHW